MSLRVAEKAALSDVGRARQGNEDSFLERSPLFAVADGMGGARAGEVASRIAVETLGEETLDGNAAEQRLAEIAKAANRRIYELAQEDASRAGMGTTFTAALVHGNELAIGHVGDSRLYRLREGELERLTHDHSLVEEFVRQGKLTPEEAEVHPQRSIITRALGPEPDVQVDTFTYPGKDGDVYLACSDGLTGMISEAVVKDILEARESLEDAAQKLIDAANENGGRDNITVVLWRLETDPDAPGDGDTLGDEATSVGLTADEVRAAVDEANALDADGRTHVRGETTKPRDVPEEARDVPQTTDPYDTPTEDTQPRDVPETTAPRDVPVTTDPYDVPPDDQTMALPAEEAAAARRASGVTAQPPERPSSPTTAPPRRSPPSEDEPGRKRTKRIAVILLVIVMLGAVAAGFKYLVLDKVFFIGTNDSGLVTLYKGVPYDLPLGVALYSEHHVSSVPARTICEPQRERILDHQLRSEGDASDLVRQVEAGRLQQDC